VSESVPQRQDIPVLGLGTYGLEGDACRRTILRALEIGYRHLDTAEDYGNESAIGEALAETPLAREEIFLTTKVWYTHLAPDDLERHAEASLDRLQTDHVDLLLIHWPNPEIPLEETLARMTALQEDGRARSIGVSNFTPELVRRAVAEAPIACNQVEYHPFLAQDELIALATRHGHVVSAYCPIARNEVADDEVIQHVAQSHGCTPAQIALRWLVQQESVVAIPRSSKSDHLRENSEVFDFELTSDEMMSIAGRARGHRIVSPDFAPDW